MISDDCFESPIFLTTDSATFSASVFSLFPLPPIPPLGFEPPCANSLTLASTAAVVESEINLAIESIAFFVTSISEPNELRRLTESSPLMPFSMRLNLIDYVFEDVNFY